ncbi:hypothetical protein CORC01_06722 [Colletotrichum orchidophilum]|uniref:Uncharacterized protein n=1 Tax=Colletotrichum orchidophilum TaxID=1209926 RepID=A0A1G4B9I8_9PEZI|nr:uncharacterized protein CORC01_06722 [Colletotrichum orchidophilum]OHE98053.1 hypothetical protein CORC01_06722 [Colletotrichum orchidophilum]
MPPKGQKPQNWTFTLIHAAVSERRHREKDWLCTSNVENAVLNLKQEKLLADAMGSRASVYKEPNHVLIVPRQGAQALKLGLGSRDRIIPKDAEYMLGYCPGTNILVIRESLRSIDQQIRLRFKSQSDLDQILGLLQTLGFQAKPMQASRRQPTPLQYLRSSSVAGDYHAPATTQPYSSGYNARLTQHKYQRRLGSPMKSQFFPEGSHPIPRANSVAAQTHRPSTSGSQREVSIHRSSDGFSTPHTLNRARTAFTEMPSEYASHTTPTNTEYLPTVPTPSTTSRRRPSVRSPPLLQHYSNWNIGPSADEAAFAEYDKQTTRPSSSTQFQDMLPPRRHLPFPVGARVEKELPEGNTTQSGISELNQESQGASKEEEALRPPTPDTETAGRPEAAERDKAAPKTRINFIKRNNADSIDNSTSKKQKYLPQTKRISTSPILPPNIPSAHFQRRTISRAPGLVIEQEERRLGEVMEKSGINDGKTGVTASASVSMTKPAEIDILRRARGAIEMCSSDADMRSKMSVEEGDSDPPSRAAVPVQHTERTDTGITMPRPSLTRIDNGTQTEPVPCSSSEKEEALFVAKFKLMWEIRDLHQTSFHGLLDTAEPNHRIDEKKTLEELEQNVIDLCQVAIDRYGPEVGDLPYEKLLKAIMVPGN